MREEWIVKTEQMHVTKPVAQAACEWRLMMGECESHASSVDLRFRYPLSDVGPLSCVAWDRLSSLTISISAWTGPSNIEDAENLSIVGVDARANICARTVGIHGSKPKPDTIMTDQCGFSRACNLDYIELLMRLFSDSNGRVNVCTVSRRLLDL